MNDISLQLKDYLFFPFFAIQTKSFMGLQHLDTGYLVNTTPLTVLTESFANFAGVFVKV